MAYRLNGLVYSVRLLSTDFAALSSSSITFAGGTLFRPDTPGADTLVGSNSFYGDYIDIRKGGSDTVMTGNGSDVIYVGAALDAGDRIDGGQFSSGSDADDVVMGGVYQTMIELGPDTIKNVGAIVTDPGSIIRLKLNDNTVASAPINSFLVSAQSEGAAGMLVLDGSAVTKYFLVFGGGGNDTIQAGSGGSYFMGGAGNDLLIGGDGVDYLNGEGGSDTLYGGAGDDRLRL